MLLLKYIYTYMRLTFSKRNKVLFFSRLSDVVLEGNNFVGRNCVIKRSLIGKYTYICNNCELSNCSIGRFCSIGSNVRVIYGNHPSSLFVSTSPVFFSKKHPAFYSTFVDNQLFEEHRLVNGKSLIVGNDVWIGANVSILEGVVIGDGAIIGANALVTKDVPPYAIVGGVPAKIIRYRFPDDVRDRILSSQWWNWDVNMIKNNVLSFNDYTRFLNDL